MNKHVKLSLFLTLCLTLTLTLTLILNIRKLIFKVNTDTSINMRSYKQSGAEMGGWRGFGMAPQNCMASLYPGTVVNHAAGPPHIKKIRSILRTYIICG